MARKIALFAVPTIVGAALMGGCQPFTQVEYDITSAECAATVAHLSNTEPDFDSAKDEAAGWVVLPGGMGTHYYLLGLEFVDGLVYDNGGDAVGYTKNMDITVGLGAMGSYNDRVIFLTEAGMASYQNNSWSAGAGMQANLYGWGAGGEMIFGDDYRVFMDPRAGGSLLATFRFGYRDYTAMSDLPIN